MLNWWVNFTVWHCIVLKEPHLALDLRTKYESDLPSQHEQKIVMKTAFEGDDSAVLIAPPPTQGDIIYIEEQFKALGFNMKLFARKVGESAEFCGWHIKVNEFGMTDAYMPDFRRTVRNMGVCASANVVNACKAGDIAEVKKAAASRVVSYAHMYRRSIPTFSRKCLEYAETLGFEGLSKEDELRLGEEGLTFLETIPAEYASAAQESAMMDKFGLSVTEAERARFEGFVWDFDRLRDFEAYKEALPEKWRP